MTRFGPSRVLLGLLLCGAAGIVQAQTLIPREWTSNSDQRWSRDANWGGNRPNTDGEYAVFGTGTQLNPELNANNYSIAGIVFEASASGYTLTDDNGARTLKLGGSNATYAFVQQNSASDQAIGIKTLSLLDPTLLDTSGTGRLTISSTLTGSSYIVKTGTGGEAVLSGNSSSFAGDIYVTAGTLRAASNRALGNTAGATVVSAGATLAIGGSGNLSSGEALTVAGLGDAGSGALRNTGNSNTFSGSIALTGDTRVQADAGKLTLSGSITGTDHTLTTAGSGDFALSGTIATGAGGLSLDGSGAVTVSGNNSYRGATLINSGVLRLGAAGSGLNSPLGRIDGGTFVNAGGALDLGGFTLGTTEALTLKGAGSGAGSLTNSGGAATFKGAVTLGAATTVGGTGNIILTGSLNGAGIDFTKIGTNTLTIASASAALGATHLQAGTLSIGVTTLHTGALDSATGATLLIASGGTVAADYAGGITVFSGALAGGGVFQKNGSGTLVFDHTFSAPSLTLSLSGGTLSLTNAAQINVGTIHITGDTILDFNNSAGTFLSSANLLIDAGVTVTIANWIGVANNTALSTRWAATTTINGGTLAGWDQVGGAPLNQIVYSNYDGLTTTWVAGNHDGWFNHEIRPTPEPATYGWIFLSLALGLVAWRRRSAV